MAWPKVGVWLGGGPGHSGVLICGFSGDRPSGPSSPGEKCTKDSKEKGSDPVSALVGTRAPGEGI